jgi:tetratricopeptide (TPR) repeat protein
LFSSRLASSINLVGRHSDPPTNCEGQRPTLGQRIREARRSLGLTQEALGRPDFTKGFISLLENDRAKPSVSSLERLAGRLGRPLAYFIGGRDSAAAKPLDVLRSRGRAELARRSFAAAFTTFDEMQRAASSVRDGAAELEAALGAGQALLGLDRIGEAQAKLVHAREQARRAGIRAVECRAAVCLADIETRAGRYAEAAALSRSAMEDADDAGAAELLLPGELQLQLGAALSRTERGEQAAEAYRAAQSIFEDAADHERAGDTLYSLAETLSSKGDHTAAMLLFERARALFEQRQATQNLSRVSEEAGALLMQMGRFREAAEYFSTSLAVKERLHDIPGECRVLTEMARCLHAGGEPSQAKTLAERAVAQSGAAGLPNEEARAQAVLGVLAAAGGDVREAQRAFASAARHFEDAGMTRELVPVLQELARLAQLAGRYKESSTYQERAFRLLQSMRPHEIEAAVRAAKQPSQRR